MASGFPSRRPLNPARGSRNGKWKGGQTTTEKGYVRLYTREGRNRYAHRACMEDMLRNPVGLMFRGDGMIPEWADVHHIDGDRAHNCQGNLMLLDRPIHLAITAAAVRYYREHAYDNWVPNSQYQEQVEDMGADIPF